MEISSDGKLYSGKHGNSKVRWNRGRELMETDDLKENSRKEKKKHKDALGI